jgi:hypothetical protein
MNTKTILVNTASPEKARSKVLIIYTGGTFVIKMVCLFLLTSG